MEKQRAKVTSPGGYQYLMEGQRPGNPQGRRKQRGQSRRGTSQDCVPMEARCLGSVWGSRERMRSGQESSLGSSN